jgi:hypothetical protein
MLARPPSAKSRMFNKFVTTENFAPAQGGGSSNAKTSFNGILRQMACGMAVLVSLSVLTGCTNTAGNVPDSSSAESDSQAGAPTIPTDSAIPTDPTQTSPTTEASTIPPTTIPPVTIPPTTIPHGDGVARNFADGTPLSEVVLSTANSIYSAAIIHNYDGLRDIIGDRRFRWGFLGERGPTKAWKEQFDAGGSDELARIALLLELAPGKDGQGRTVWPAVALKEPSEWTLEDEAVLAKLGFNPEDIDQTRSKGRYIDYKLVIDANGLWTAFGVGY